MAVKRAVHVDGDSGDRLPVAETDAAGFPGLRGGRPGLGNRFLRSPLAVVGAALLLILILWAVAGPALWRIDPLKQSLLARNHPPGWIDARGVDHYLGTDPLGRDVAARLILGTRVSLIVGALSTVGAALLGVFAGLVAGYFSGKTDALIMRVVDVQMSFPFILIAIIWALFIGTGAGSIIFIVALRGWVTYARIVRSRILAVRELAYIEAARSIGASAPRILTRHVLPQTVSSVTIISALQVGTAVIFESTLGFLGLGIQPPTPTLGNMLADGQSYLESAWWLVVLPGVLLILIVVAVNTLGDGLRDVLDPQTAHGRR